MRNHIAALLAVLVLPVATAEDSLPDRHEALVATTRAFAFYSDPVFNLHDFLVWSSRSKEPVEPAPDCLEGLPAEQRAAFELARDYYKVFSGAAVFDRVLLALRYRLAGFPDSGLADPAAIDAALSEVRAAAPAYQKCWWPVHDARNRRWIAALTPLLGEHEQVLSSRLSKLYGKKLQQPLPVDVVSYNNFAGANSVVDPNHLLISSVVPANQGYAALEVVFHEASHTLFGPKLDGRLWMALDAAVKADGAPLVPEDYWHVILFYTTGGAVKARMAERGVTYEPLLYSQKLFQRSWAPLREPLERVWQPYVDGRVAMDKAVKQLVHTPTLPDRGDAFVAASHTFSFYSDAVTNLHDFLVWNARSPAPVEPKPQCLAGLPADQRAAFEHARDYYAKTFANGAGELVLLSMSWRLAKFGELDITDPAQIAAAAAELSPAMPAYMACWWREHDARNRRWIADLLPVLKTNEDALRARLAQLYGKEFDRWLPVDVVGYASADGGGTVLNPHHFTISRSNVGYSALEVLFREASNSLFSIRARGALWQSLQDASSAAAKAPVQEDFRRFLLSFTTGAAVQARLAEQGVPDYKPYLYRDGAADQASSANREMLERTLQPYIDDRVPMGEAVSKLVEALPSR